MVSLFFYGTLCHAGVLTRVIGNNGNHLRMNDAMLLGHARLHVEGEDYPAVISAQDGEKIMGRALSEDESSVRGVLVQGLTEDDVGLLDEFEGDEYSRSPCSVCLISSNSSSSQSSSPLPASVYLWTAPLARLTPKVWTFEAFMRDSAHRWVGVGSASNPDFAEVDRRRAMGGVIMPRGVEKEAEKVEKELETGELDKKLEEVGGEKHEKFGKKLGEKYWGFKEGWTNLNHGAYGAPPTPVVAAMREVQDTINGSADKFMKWTYEPQLIALRERLADFVQADVNDVVIVGNTTVGVNTILKSLTTEWKKGDRLLYISTSIYNACAANLQHVIDTHAHLSLSLLPVSVVYPISHANLITTVRKAIEDAENDGTGRRVRLALVDAISSSPAVVVPWAELVELFRKKGIMSLVDAAHEIGQQPVNLRVSKPDFWVSNTHKWLYSHRAVALLYVDKRYQHLIHSTPIGHAYRSPSSSTNSRLQQPWHTEFVWHSTVDWSPIMSTHAALDFRRDVLGGEERIQKWCFELAKKGGQVVADRLGTTVIRNEEGEGELTAAMINVQLPLPPQSSFSPEEQAVLAKWWIGQLVNTHKTHVPIFAHNDQFHVRLSAQVYNDLSDFEFIGAVLQSLCERIRKKEYVVDTKKVDKALESGQVQEQLEEVGMEQQLEAFGKKLGEKYWTFKEGWTNLNHGGYGAPPKPVIAALRQVQDTINGSPDEFMKWTYEPQLHTLRERLADFVKADVDDVVIVGNTTTGVNTVLKSLTTEWKKGDRLLYISTTVFSSSAHNLQHVVDTHPHLSLSLLPVPVVYPISHPTLISTVRKAIEEAENDGTGRRVRLALIDAISSLPGVVVPWTELVELFREKDVMSLVDAAHEIGQQPVNLCTSKPDFWVSNTHKWLYSHRAVALLYVDKRYQYLMHSTPVGHAYRSPSSSTNSPSQKPWHTEFVWHSTVDWAPIMSTQAALDFRRDVLGGEERIRKWCHELAKRGGEEVARRLGTKVIANQEEKGELIAAMVNVELPLPPQSSFSPEEQAVLAKWWIGQLVNTHKTHVPLFAHDDRFHVRLAAQVYNDISDFEWIGGVLKSMCERIEKKEFQEKA